MKQISTLLTGIAVGGFAAAATWHISDRIDVRSIVSPADAAIPDAEAPLPVVETATAVSQDLTRWEEFPGRFEAVDHVNVRARVEGQLEDVHFRPGEVVEQGDLLFTIDPRPFQSALSQAEARLAEAVAAERLAAVELERQSTLVQQGHASQAVMDRATQAAEVARASIAAAEAAVERARLDLSFTRIHAPVTGRISDDALRPGNLVQAGVNGPVLTTIVSLDPVHFVFDATERQYLDHIRSADAGGLDRSGEGARVAIRLIDEADFSHEGTLDFVDNSIDRASGTIRGRALLSNADGLLTPGMFGRMRLAAAEAVPTVLIPEEAVGADQAERFVWVVTEEGTTRRRVVTLGNQANGMRIVEDGLAVGERVIVAGLHHAGEGVRVAARNTQEFGAEAPVEVAAR